MLNVWRTRPGVAVAAIAVLMASSSVWGGGYYCRSIRHRVMYADAIVVGRTTRVTREEVRPTLHAFTFEFQIDRVLKGDLYHAGDTIVRRFEPDERIISWNPLPWDDEKGLHLVFVTRNESGEEQLACAASVAEVDLGAIRRQIEVEENPPAYFPSDDEQDVFTVLDWIERTYFRYEKKRGRYVDWSDKSAPSRETIIRYLLKHARGERDDLSVRALDILADIHPPEAFDVFKNALQSKDDGDKIAHAARGFRLLADGRAIPLLIDRWKSFREEETDRSRRIQAGEDVTRLKWRPRGWGGPPSGWDPKYELRADVTSFDDPRVQQFLLDSLSEGRGGWALADMGRLDDPRAVEPLLRSLWEGNASAIEQLAKFDDERIVNEAQERLYDDPLAARLLAARGDPSVRAYMTRVIRQGFPVGFWWAAAAREESVKSDLVRAFAEYPNDPFHSRRTAYALGRIRAFDVVASILKQDFSDHDVALNGMEMLLGLSDRSWGMQIDCQPGEQWNCIRRSLREVATREQWTASRVTIADELVNAVENRKEPPTRYNIGSIIPRHPWSSPESLPDMPDPLDKVATSKYLEQNAERCRRVFVDGSIEDQSKLLQAANYCGVTIPDREMIVSLLVGSDWQIRSLAYFSMTGDHVALRLPDMERWALTGDYESTRMALMYIVRQPKPEYAPIVTKLFLRGRLLFLDTLFEAIIETNATGCIPLLRAYLHNEHYTLRVNAAITLIHLGDDAGKPVLAELEPNLRGCIRCLRRDYLQEALDQLH